MKNCQERERKLKKELEENKSYSNKTDEIVKQMTKENEDLKLKLNFVKDSLEKNLKANHKLQKLSDSMESKLKDLEEEHLACKRESVMVENNVNHVTAVTNFENRLKETDDLIEMLKEENILWKQKHDDVVDELLLKKKEVLDLEESNGKMLLKNSSSSLDEELQQVARFICETCNLNILQHTACL